jgi:hypothetical protein
MARMSYTRVWQKYVKLYNTLYQYYTKSKQLSLSVKQHQSAIYWFKSYTEVKLPLKRPVQKIV